MHSAIYTLRDVVAQDLNVIVAVLYRRLRRSSVQGKSTAEFFPGGMVSVDVPHWCTVDGCGIPVLCPQLTHRVIRRRAGAVGDPAVDCQAAPRSNGCGDGGRFPLLAIGARGRAAESWRAFLFGEAALVCDRRYSSKQRL